MRSRFSPLLITVLLMFVISLAATSMTARAAGPHDNDCKDCHSIHYSRGDAILAVDPFQTENPSTGMTITDVSSLCLGCHNDAGEATAIDLMRSHPIGIAPKKATVPRDKLSPEGLLACVSCHDPHPSNDSYAYLIVSTDGGSSMGKFCAVCHPYQGEQ